MKLYALDSANVNDSLPVRTIENSWVEHFLNLFQCNKICNVFFSAESNNVIKIFPYKASYKISWRFIKA